MKDPAKCKICGSINLKVFAHTAYCQDCKILLYYPYFENKELENIESTGIKEWYYKASFLNHINFTNMLNFTISYDDNSNKELKILDYGGGGGAICINMQICLS